MNIEDASTIEMLKYKVAEQQKQLNKLYDTHMRFKQSIYDALDLGVEDDPLEAIKKLKSYSKDEVLNWSTDVSTW